MVLRGKSSNNGMQLTQRKASEGWPAPSAALPAIIIYWRCAADPERYADTSEL